MNNEGGKLTLLLAWLAGLEPVTVPGYYGSATTGNKTPLKYGHQHLNLQLLNVNRKWESKNYSHVNKKRDNSLLFILTNQLITTSQNKCKEGWIKSAEQRKQTWINAAVKFTC